MKTEREFIDMVSVILSERSLRVKNLDPRCRRFFVARRALAPQNDTLELEINKIGRRRIQKDNNSNRRKDVVSGLEVDAVNPIMIDEVFERKQQRIDPDHDQHDKASSQLFACAIERRHYQRGPKPG